MSRADIDGIANRVRSLMGVKEPKFPVAELLEFVLPKLRPQFELEILDREEMGQKHGAVDPVDKRIMIRTDVYDGMVADRGRDRFTVTHEVGHALLHDNPVTLNRVREKPKPYECPEWQAHWFAGSVLMPERYIRDMSSVREMAAVFGVSLDAAEVRLRKLNMRLPQS